MSSPSIQKRIPIPLFRPGSVVATPGALETMAQYGTDSMALLRRHLSGDWGDVGADDAKSNEEAVLGERRVFSSYVLKSPQVPDLPEAKIWVITEADRSATTFLLPEEY